MRVMQEFLLLVYCGVCFNSWLDLPWAQPSGLVSPWTGVDVPAFTTGHGDTDQKLVEQASSAFSVDLAFLL